MPATASARTSPKLLSSKAAPASALAYELELELELTKNCDYSNSEDASVNIAYYNTSTARQNSEESP
jgi:hypothetical protein